VARTLTLRLAPFERDAVDSYGASQRVPAARLVRTAVLYYLREQHANRSTWPSPKLRHEESGAPFMLDVDLGEKTGRALAEQAAAQRVEPEQLARHALLFFLADVDSGRVARALERALRPD
jgi:hypothetical protein